MRTLGPGAFGTYGLAMAFVGYLQILLEYGFWLSGTRRAVAVLHDPAALSKLFWAIYGTKLILLFLALPPMALFIFLVPALHNCVEIIIVLAIGVVGASIFPLWLLQARGLLKDFAWILTLLKISNLAVFIFIRGPGDVRALAYIFAIQSIMHGLIGQYAALKGIKISAPTSAWIRDSFNQLRADFSIFISQLGGTLISNSTSVVLGTTAGPESLGAYMVADKIVRAAASLTIPVSQAVLPMSANLFQFDTPRNAFNFLRKFSFVAGGAITFGCLFLAVFAPFVIHLVSGTRSPEIILCLRILAFYPIFVFANNLFGPQVLLQIEKDASILKSNLLGCAFGLLLHPILIPIFHARGAAAIVFLAEATVTPLLIYFVYIAYKAMRKNGNFDRIKSAWIMNCPPS
ncbi:MAG: oligosaccharide flippase family protein [Fibrobacterota bacterium]|nr:oligosaccharide flippase family protein [Fibrobacterota bacterium]QQS06089.1 MAG: oligosaccharide flippase family protein [Fibrobacterota bacterium]